MQLSVKEIIDIVYGMKEYGCVVFGAGNRGKIALRMLDSLEIEVKAVFDSVEGKEIEGRNAETLACMEKYSPKLVCIVTPAQNVTDVWNILKEYFDLVTDMQIFDWMMYLVPDKEESVFTNSGILHPFNFYDSPYLSKKEWTYYENTADRWQKVEDIDLNIEYQRLQLRNFKQYFTDYQAALLVGNPKLRYTEENDMFSLPDALLLHSIIRKYKPKRIIEIGSGYSTFVTLDTVEYFMEEGCSVTCIEPYPDRLFSRLRADDRKKVAIYEQFVQSVPLEIFQELEAGDILFIDSSHVAKMGADVLWEYFHILPCLNPGVIIHIHDLFYPFIYPLSWIRQGRAYNEAFIVRALLMNSSQYEILIWNDMMIGGYYEEYLENWNREYPPYGGSLWIRKR